MLLFEISSHKFFCFSRKNNNYGKMITHSEYSFQMQIERSILCLKVLSGFVRSFSYLKQQSLHKSNKAHCILSIVRVRWECHSSSYLVEVLYTDQIHFITILHHTTAGCVLNQSCLHKWDALAKAMRLPSVSFKFVQNVAKWLFHSSVREREYMSIL